MADLTHPQRRAIAALLTEGNVTRAPARCGVGVRTLHRWLRDPSFRRAFRQASFRCLEDAVALMQSSTVDAVGTLRAALRSESESVRLRAALGIVDAASKLLVSEWRRNEAAGVVMTKDQVLGVIDEIATVVEKYVCDPQQLLTLAGEFKARAQ